MLIIRGETQGILAADIVYKYYHLPRRKETERKKNVLGNDWS